MQSPMGMDNAERTLCACAPEGANKHVRETGCKQNLCLSAIFARLNETYFHGLCQAHIGWGRSGAPRRRQRRSILLGSFCSAEERIRIHPVLREPWVPGFVVELVVFHEMLHAYLGVEVQGGRRRVHSPEFRAIEASHPAYQAACAWERRHLGRLLRS